MQHVYKPATVMIVFMIIGLLFFGGFGGSSFVEAAREHNISLMILSSLIMFFGLYCIVGLTERVYLSDDMIERRTILTSRRLRRDEIAGWKIIENYTKSGVNYSLKILPKDEQNAKPVNISSSIQVDLYFKSWLMPLPNLSQNWVERKIAKLLAKSPNATAKAAQMRAKYEARKDNIWLLSPTALAAPAELANNYFAQWSL